MTKKIAKTQTIVKRKRAAQAVSEDDKHEGPSDEMIKFYKFLRRELESNPDYESTDRRRCGPCVSIHITQSMADYLGIEESDAECLAEDEDYGY